MKITKSSYTYLCTFKHLNVQQAHNETFSKLYYKYVYPYNMRNNASYHSKKQSN